METPLEPAPNGASEEKQPVPEHQETTTAAPVPAPALAVRFASATEEIEPPKSLEPADDSNPEPRSSTEEDENLKEIKKLHGSQLQGRRASAYAFEVMSLPASRVPSHDDSSREASRHNTFNSSTRPSPHQSPRVSSMHSPPITPAATRSREVADAQLKSGAALEKVDAEGDAGPQITPPQDPSPTTTHADDSRPGSSGASTRPTSHSAESTKESDKHRHSAAFSIGPTSVPASRDTSPSRTPQSFSRPFTPAGDQNDPYASHRRPPQSNNLDAIDARFKFNALGAKRGSTGHLPRSSGSKSDSEGKRHSAIFGGSHHLSGLNDDSSSTLHDRDRKHGSMSELKRFLKIGKSKATTTKSPTPSVRGSIASLTTLATPAVGGKPTQLPFEDAHGIVEKYGKFGKVLGAGAGGSVRLLKRSDGRVFAVKEFRARHSHETEKEYGKKVTAEFCVGSALHHGNIIETLDIINEKGKWYEVMEYAPYDLFAIVMTGKMSKEEVTCAFLQITSGVSFLHGSGLAHRDLKLDNVVVNEYGIMKIIDFGSATVFKYPFENGLTLAHGIVGSDPYLAPEVYDLRKYDPQPVDIWSLAIIFCCMSLRRFPWKMPRMTDNSYKMFASTPTPGTDMRRISDVPSKSTSDLDTPARDAIPDDSSAASSPTKAPSSIETVKQAEADKEKVPLKGPWRLLRLLPRETRHIMSRMLEIDPKKRASMTEVIEDSWVLSSEPNVCRQEEGLHGVPGKVFAGANHKHTLEGPAPPAENKK